MNSDYTPYEWNMTLYRDDTWPRNSFSIVDANNSPRPLDTASIKMQIRKNVGEAPVKELTHLSGFVVTGNSVVFNTTVDLPAGSYVYDIEITYLSGEVKTYFQGKIKVKNGVTS